MNPNLKALIVIHAGTGQIENYAEYRKRLVDDIANLGTFEEVGIEVRHPTTDQLLGEIIISSVPAGDEERAEFQIRTHAAGHPLFDSNFDAYTPVGATSLAHVAVVHLSTL